MIMPEILLGETICKLIKDIYYKEVKWPLCYGNVAAKFSMFKKIMYKFHSVTQCDVIEILEMAQKFSESDMMEVFEMENLYFGENGKGTSQEKKYGNRVTWLPVPIDKPEVLEKMRQMLK